MPEASGGAPGAPSAEGRRRPAVGGSQFLQAARRGAVGRAGGPRSSRTGRTKSGRGAGRDPRRSPMRGRRARPAAGTGPAQAGRRRHTGPGGPRGDRPDPVRRGGGAARTVRTGAIPPAPGGAWTVRAPDAAALAASARPGRTPASGAGAGATADRAAQGGAGAARAARPETAAARSEPPPGCRRGVLTHCRRWPRPVWSGSASTGGGPHTISSPRRSPPGWRRERGRLHALLAGALEAEDADPSEIARHHREAGDTSAAAITYADAAERALAAQRDRRRSPCAGPAAR